MIRMNTRINIQIKNIGIYEYLNIFVTLCNATHATSQYNNYHMTQRTHVPRCSCFDDDNSDSGTTDIQSTHGRPRFTLPATLPVTRIFFHYPTRTLPEVKKPYPSQPGYIIMFIISFFIMFISFIITPVDILLIFREKWFSADGDFGSDNSH